MDEANHVNEDDDEVVFSPHTNRPTIKQVTPSLPHIFWCGTCHLKLTSPASAIQHLNGRSHKSKINAKQDENGDVLKLKHTFDAACNIKPAEPVTPLLTTKKNKDKDKAGKAAVSDANLTCEDCNLVFDSAMIAIQHFKGKKHVAKVSAKVIAKQNEWRRGLQRGRGGGGRGRGDFGRDGGIMGPMNNNCFGRTFNDMQRNNHMMHGYYSNAQQQDYAHHFNCSNGDSPRNGPNGRMDVPYYDCDSTSSIASNNSQLGKKAGKNQQMRGSQNEGGRWQTVRGKGVMRGGYNKDGGKYNRGGFSDGQSFPCKGNGRGFAPYGEPNTLSPTWWCKYFVKGNPMKANS